MNIKHTILLALLCIAPSAPETDVERWEREATRVTIVRDDWGIPHIYGSKDADVVFGLMYAQAEDDFNRVETNYLNSMGRLAEAEGESQIYRDLRMKLFVDPVVVKALYNTSPAWMKTLTMAWADGLNFYLYKHPEVKPRVIKRFEPWMALTFTEGSIGGNIEGVKLQDLEAFYGSRTKRSAVVEDTVRREPGGSNGIAIAPSNTANGHALLLINPHTSFFFRAEAQAVSEEGLNAYGALTWGQFFVYQGFNDRAGWMHTTSSIDAVDEYLETVDERTDGLYYRYGTGYRKLDWKKIAIPYKTPTGMATKEFTVYRTHHGPVVREVDGKWVTVRMMYEPVKALTQSYMRTKARDLASYKKLFDLHANSSNNTLFADSKGEIAFFHANFSPRRDPRFDWTKPVDGSDPATEWRGLHAVDESPNVVNPKSGWAYNTNNWPYSAAGASSPRRENFPSYMDIGTENYRGIHAMRLLSTTKDFTLESLLSAAFDSYLPAFDELLPPLFAAYNQLPANDRLHTALSEQIEMLRTWDRRWSAASVPTTLAVLWGDELPSNPSPAQRVRALADVSDRLQQEFGTWKTPWGDVNRFQRLNGDITQKFDDARPSIPIPFTSAQWGSLASFGARRYPGTKKMYGTSGNSFVAVVEFGDSVRAKAVSAGGESGNPMSPHFNDQAGRYSTGALRDVYFYKSQLKGHTERTYHPGQ